MAKRDSGPKPPKKAKPARRKPGPEPETLAIEGDWRQAIKRTLPKKKAPPRR